MPGQPDDSQSLRVETLRPSGWMRQILLETAVYNIAWGAYRKLVNTNWIRTVAWTARGVILMVITYRHLGAD